MARPSRPIVGFIKAVFKNFGDDDCMTLAAAVAFYTALSFAPLVLLVVAIGGFLGPEGKNDLLEFFSEQMGPRTADVTQGVLEASQKSSEEQSIWRWVVSTVMLAVSASGVFGQLQASLNRIWRTEAKPKRVGWWNWLRQRLMSLGMVLVILFIMLVALVMSAIINMALPGDGEGVLARILLYVVSIGVATLLFAAIFKVLPDTRIAWREVWLGALVTALLFTIGKELLSLYLAHGGVGDQYGKAAGSLIALMVWVYYSCVILFLGAEVTQVHAQIRRPASVPAKPPGPPPAPPKARPVGA